MTLQVQAPLGKLILTRDPIERSHRGIGGVEIFYPDEGSTWKGEHRVANTGLVLLHSQSWLDENLTGKRIIFDKWAGVPWYLEGTEFYTIPERACLAVFE